MVDSSLAGVGEHILAEDVASVLNQSHDMALRDRLRAHIRVCAACEERFVAELLTKLAETQKGNTERRTIERVKVGDAGSLQSLCPLSFDRVEVHILDATRAGVGVATHSPLEVGATVLVDLAETKLVGEVRYCHLSHDSNYHLGIALTNRARR